MINQHLGDHMTESRKSPYFWKLQISYWVAYTILQVLAGWALLFKEIISRGSEELLLEFIILRSVYGILITSSIRPLFVRIHSRRWHPLLMTLVLLGVSLSYSTVELLLIKQIPLLREYFGSLTENLLMGTNIMVLGLYLDFFFFALWVGCYFTGSLFFDSLELSRRQQKSELSLLRYQMQPHFLFNALTAVMAVSGDRTKVEVLTQSLADYLRFSLRRSDGDTFPLREELEALENYLQVEKIRFEDNLNYRIDADEKASDVCVLPHLVQPLLENAIKYGQQTSPMPLSIGIEAQIMGQQLHLAVENTGSWVEPSASSRGDGMGIGLSNLRRRLQLLYSDRATLSHEYSSQSVRAIVTLPIMNP